MTTMTNIYLQLHKRRKLGGLVLAAVAVTAVLIGTVNRFNAANAAGANATDASEAIFVRQGDIIKIPAKSPLRTRLLVTTVNASAPSHAIQLPAAVEADPAFTVNVLAPLSGRLAELKVKLGDTVKQGQTLAIVSSPDLEQAYSDVDKSRDALELAQKALERARGVNAAGANAVKDFEQANSNYVQALAEARRAEARLKTLTSGGDAKGKSRLLTITAPTSGTVTALNIGAGAYINDTTASLMTIANLNNVWITANVPEQLVSMVSKGQAVDASLPAYPGQVFHGKVSFVSAVLEPDTRRNKVRIGFANTDGRFKPNMYATVSIDIAQPKQVVVPTSALLMNNDNTTVFVEVAPWSFKRRAVELGLEDNGSVRILSGLNTGDRVVTRGGVLLND